MKSRQRACVPWYAPEPVEFAQRTPVERAAREREHRRLRALASRFSYRAKEQGWNGGTDLAVSVG